LRSKVEPFIRTCASKADFSQATTFINRETIIIKSSGVEYNVKYGEGKEGTTKIDVKLTCILPPKK
jgi:hypothetical protein